MLKAIPTNPTMTAAWQEHISPGDIVSFRFPLAEEGRSGRPKARPCLVLGIEDHDGHRCLLLAYGTTSRRRSNIGYEVHARRRTDYTAAGLDEPTRFVGARRLLVPLNNRGFAICSGTGSPVIGRLHGRALEVMHTVCRRLQHEGGAAARNRARQRHGAIRGRDFTVEHRKPRQIFASGKAVMQ